MQVPVSVWITMFDAALSSGTSLRVDICKGGLECNHRGLHKLVPLHETAVGNAEQPRVNRWAHDAAQSIDCLVLADDTSVCDVRHREHGLQVLFIDQGWVAPALHPLQVLHDVLPGGNRFHKQELSCQGLRWKQKAFYMTDVIGSNFLTRVPHRSIVIAGGLQK